MSVGRRWSNGPLQVPLRPGKAAPVSTRADINTDPQILTPSPTKGRHIYTDPQTLTPRQGKERHANTDPQILTPRLTKGRHVNTDQQTLTPTVHEVQIR